MVSVLSGYDADTSRGISFTRSESNHKMLFFLLSKTMAAQQEAAAARAKIAKAKEDAKKKAKAKAEAKKKKLEEDIEASGDIKDPYQYVRNMPKGASMQPIESHPGAANSPHGHSDPIILFKNSQISNAVAAKKNAIPKPSGKSYGK